MKDKDPKDLGKAILDVLTIHNKSLEGIELSNRSMWEASSLMNKKIKKLEKKIKQMDRVIDNLTGGGLGEK